VRLSFDAVGECSQWDHYFHANFSGVGEDTMRIFGYLSIGFLIVWFLAPAPMAITVTDTEPVQAAPDATQPLQQQNQMDSALERLPDLAEEEQDLLNILD
jgi:hypothetical protein